jgi:hypothetical protein
MFGRNCKTVTAAVLLGVGVIETGAALASPATDDGQDRQAPTALSLSALSTGVSISQIHGASYGLPVFMSRVDPIVGQEFVFSQLDIFTKIDQG